MAFFLVLPLATAFSSWLTVRVMLHWIRYPVKPVNLFGFTLQGFLFKNQNAIAERIGEGIAVELANTDISTLLADETALQDLNPLIAQHLDSFLRIRLKEKMPVIAAFIGDSTIIKLKDSMMEEITVLLPEVISKYAAAITTNPAVKEKITIAIATYPPQKIEAHIAPALTTAAQKLPLLAALAGFIIGVVIATIVYLIM